MPAASPASQSSPFDVNALAALRAWHEGMPSRQAVQRYLPERLNAGHTARGVLGAVRRELAMHARSRLRDDLAEVFERPAAERTRHARAVAAALDELRHLPAPQPLVGDALERWLPSRAAAALKGQGIRTLAQLTVRIPRRRQWWVAVPGLGQASAREIEAFFAAHPQLTERARALIAQDAPGDIVPLERMTSPRAELDGSRGRFRAPAHTCLIDASHDGEAVLSWLQLHESLATRRAYRKEAERLLLWAVIQLGKPLSSLTTDDAIAYRAFLRNPTPQRRWVGPPRPRKSGEWRPFAGALAPKSIAYALSVLGAMFRWLMAQHYVLANPFAGIKVRGAGDRQPLDKGRAFSQAEWRLVRTIADGLEVSYGWERGAADRVRFLLDFGYATGLRAGELVGVKLRDVRKDERDDWWLHVVGKGAKNGKVALPPLARSALDHYLCVRGLPTSPELWVPATPLLARIGAEDRGITGARLWAVMKRFFTTAAKVLERDAPALAAKLRQASPHWMRHSHASHALAAGADLTTVRDNLRHASITTTSTYLHGEEVKRARQLAAAFGL